MKDTIFNLFCAKGEEISSDNFWEINFAEVEKINEKKSSDLKTKNTIIRLEKVIK